MSDRFDRARPVTGGRGAVPPMPGGLVWRDDRTAANTPRDPTPQERIVTGEGASGQAARKVAGRNRCRLRGARSRDFFHNSKARRMPAGSKPKTSHRFTKENGQS